MATQLTMVNRVLRRLREDTVTVVNANEYSALIGDFVADAYDEIQDAHDWETLKHRVGVDLIASTTEYDLTVFLAGGGSVRDSDDRVCTIDSELQFSDSNIPRAWVYDDDSAASPAGDLCFLSPEDFDTLQGLNRNLTASVPTHFTVAPAYTAANGDTNLYLKVYPSPTAVKVIEMEFLTPAPELLVDGTTDASIILVPDRPLYMLSLMYAYNERGEELGEPGSLAERRYVNAIAVAIERDITSHGKADRYQWRRG